MLLDPAPPDGLAALVDAYASCVQAVIDVGHGLRAGESELPTDCPGWTVFDQVAHVASVEAMLAGEPVPEVEVAHHPHVRHRFGAVIERYVESRRGRVLEDVLAELEAAVEDRLAFYRDPLTTAGTEVTGPFGQTTVVGLLDLRVFDIWTHEQDIREALGRPGGLGSVGAAHFVARMFAAFPRVVAKDAAVPPGHAVILDLTGPVTGRAGVRVEQRKGEPLGIPLFTGGSEDHPEVVATTITMSTQAATRRAAGRRTPDEVHHTVTGDPEIARRVLDALVLTP